MTRRLFLIDPPPDPRWAPFAGSRPLATLRAGAKTIWRRWCDASDTANVTTLVAPHLVGFEQLTSGPPTGTADRHIPGPAIVGNSDFVPLETLPDIPDVLTALTNNGRQVGWLIPAGHGIDLEQLPEAPNREVEGLTLAGTFDLVGVIEVLLATDLEPKNQSTRVPSGVTILGDAARLIAPEADLEPGVVVDVRDGPVVIDAGATIRSDSRLQGPLWIGSHTAVLGGPVARSTIGPWCKVRGEMTDTVMLGFANKSHDGFVGHSVIGEWANLGAQTVTSNLKNTYGPIRLTVDGTRIETGRTLLGALVGDHAKTAIGTLLGTGTIVGTGANVFGAVRPPPHVRPFAWGASGEELLTREAFLTTVGRVLPRREVTFDESTAALLGRLYDTLTAR